MPLERRLRLVWIDRKNYSFARSDIGGEKTPEIDTRIGSAMRRGVDPAACFRFVLERIAEHPIPRIQGLLPGNLVEARWTRNAPRADSWNDPGFWPGRSVKPWRIEWF